MINEILKKIDGYDYYIVSDLGNVYSYLIQGHGGLVRKKPKKIKAIKNNNGYYSVTLYKDSVPFKISVHRIVAICFIPNPDGLPHVAHLDGDKSNNSVKNLIWATSKENCSHKKMHGTSQTGERNGMSKISDLDREIIKISQERVRVLAKKYNVNDSTIRRIKAL